MAYAFDRIMNLMGRNQKDEPTGQQTNIFAPQGNNQAGPSSGQQTDRVRAASTETALPGGGQGGMPGGQAPALPPGGEQTPASRSRLFESNVGRVKSPVNLSEMGQTIANRGDQLQKEANSYVQQAGNVYGGGLSEDTAKNIGIFSGLQSGRESNLPVGAVLGGEPVGPLPGSDISAAAQQPIQGLDWKSAFTAGPGKVDVYAPGVNTNIANADKLSTDAGIQELFRQGGGAEYSAGDAAFDAALLRKDQAFNALRAQTLAQNAELQRKKSKIGDEATKQAQQALENSYSGWKQQVADQLSANADKIQGLAGGRESQFDQNLMAQIEKDKAKGQSQADKVFKDLIAQNPEMKAQLKQVSYDPSPYAGVSGIDADKTAWQDFVNTNEAQGWNNIMSILGKGGQALSKGQYFGKNYGDFVDPTFDSSAFAEKVLADAEKMSVQPPAAEQVEPEAPVGAGGPSGPIPWGGEKGNDISYPPYLDPFRLPFGGEDLPNPLSGVPIVGPLTDKANQTVSDKKEKLQGYIDDRAPKKPENPLQKKKKKLF